MSELIKLTQKDIDNETDKYYEALSQSTFEAFKDSFYYDNLNINDYIKISKVYNDSKSFILDLPCDEKFLLSFSNSENLDGVWFDVETVIWNDIVLNDDDRQAYNQYTVEQECIYFLFNDIEEEIMNSDLEIDNDFKTNIFVSKSVIRSLINHHLKDYLNKINVELLIDFIIDGIKDLDTWISNSISDYFESEEFYNWIDDIEYYQMDYFMSEINRNGFVEVYI